MEAWIIACVLALIALRAVCKAHAMRKKLNGIYKTALADQRRMKAQIETLQLKLEVDNGKDTAHARA
jgi:hypothetical protein